MGIIRVGTASWTDKTLLAAGWYPADVKTSQDRLSYYATQFPIVEVDSTYYTPPSERNSLLWAQRTPADFIFDVKAFALLTQHPTNVRSLYKDLRPKQESGNVYLKDLEDKVIDQVWDRFISALVPLHNAGKLGAILFQFPQWFPIGARTKRYLLDCKYRCDPLQICVEFRNKTWLSKENQAETLDFLISHAVPYVCVDMPQGYPSSVPPIAAATADLAVVRFHGQSEKWTSKNIYEKFGYKYSGKELARWVPRITELATEANDVHVMMNNCYSDYAQTNAQQLTDLLSAVE